MVVRQVDPKDAKLPGLWSRHFSDPRLGTDRECRALSRATATLYGIVSALTLDEFALWFDLQDDYWTRQGRKSIDAVALFSSLLTAGVAGRGALREVSGVARKALGRLS